MLLDEKQRELQRRTESIRSLALGSFSKTVKERSVLPSDELASDHSGPRTSKGREGFH